MRKLLEPSSTRRATHTLPVSALLLALCCTAAAAQSAPPSLRGAVTDPSGASVPAALVQLLGPGGDQRARTDASGQYVFSSLRPGKYQVRVIARGFTVHQRRDFEIAGPTLLDVQLAIEMEKQVVNVEDEANSVTTDPGSNGGALVLREKELAALSDDPDELEQQLQAMAGPGGGPNGGQIYIDGFTGGRIPPKSSIREVRINSNPYSPEFDRPGFGRIEILTRPGSDNIRGQAFFQFNNQYLNSRNPLLAQSDRPPYMQRFFGFNLSGPLKKQKASFGFDFERRNIDENAFVYATTLDKNLNPVTVNEAILTPQSRTNLSPRLDYALTRNHNLVLRYQYSEVGMDKEGVGDYSLQSRAYAQNDSEHTVQLTETAILSARAVNELRFQYMRTNLARTGDNSTPALSVAGAFEGGGPQIGNSGSLNARWESTNVTTYTAGPHTLKWGARLRRSTDDDTSVNNFGGAYAFFGGVGPLLDSNNQPIPGTSAQLSALERYRRTLLFQSAGFTPARIRELGGGASQFSLSSGTPKTSVAQFDAGLFFNDDWRLRQNLTLSYGLRYETQTNIGDHTDFAPRIGVAWGIDGGRGRQARTILRAGFGLFYDRIAQSVTLQADRYNGVTQQSYLILNPDFFPAVPSSDVLAQAKQPQRLQFVDSTAQAPRTLQTSLAIERQINRYARFSAQYLNARGVHLQRSRNINAPVNGVYPYSDGQSRMLTETTGFSRTNQLILSPSVNYKKLFLFGFYALSSGMTDAEGTPADPYNLRTEWGPSSFAGVRHRAVVGTNLPLPWKFSISPFLMGSSGSPYNITTGRDTNGDGFTAERPALVANLAAAQCNSGSLVYAPGFGCFNLNPTAGATTINRNFARGPANVNLGLRLARSWAFGNKGESGPAEDGPPPGMGGARGGGPPGGGPGGGGPPPGMGGGGPGGGPPPGLFGATSGRKYNLMLSVSARNVFNHANYAAPSGDLSSPFFGEFRSLGGLGPFGGSTTYNRKIDVQLRFMF